MRIALGFSLGVVAVVGSLLSACLFVLYLSSLLGDYHVKTEVAGLPTPAFVLLVAGVSGSLLFFAGKELKSTLPWFKKDAAASYRTDTLCWVFAIYCLLTALDDCLVADPHGIIGIDVHSHLFRDFGLLYLLAGTALFAVAIYRASLAKRRTHLTYADANKLKNGFVPWSFGMTVMALVSIAAIGWAGDIRHFGSWLPWAELPFLAWGATFYWINKTRRLRAAEPPAEDKER